jgi:hypothetical protein
MKNPRLTPGRRKPRASKTLLASAACMPSPTAPDNSNLAQKWDREADWHLSHGRHATAEFLSHRAAELRQGGTA